MLGTRSGASTESKNEVNTYASPNEALTLKSLGLGAGWVGILKEIRDVQKGQRIVKNFLITKDRSFLSMTRILSPVLDDKGTKKKRIT